MSPFPLSIYLSLDTPNLKWNECFSSLYLNTCLSSHHLPQVWSICIVYVVGFESCSPDLFSIQHCVLVPYSPDVVVCAPPFPREWSPRSCCGLPLLVGGVMVLWQAQHPNALVGPLQVWACWELLGLGAVSGTPCLLQPQLTLGGLDGCKPEHRERCLVTCHLHPSRTVYGALAQETSPTSASETVQWATWARLFRTSQDLPARCPGNSDGLNAEMRGGNVEDVFSMDVCTGWNQTLNLAG